MKTLFKWWFGLLLFSYMLFTPIYLFSNSSTDEVEEVTYEQLLPSFVGSRISADELERKLDILNEAFNVETDKELFDALEELDEVDDLSVKVVETLPQKVDGSIEYLQHIVVSFSFKEAVQYELNFIVSDKSFFPPNYTKFYAFTSMNNSIIGRYSRHQAMDFFEKLFNSDEPRI